MNAIPKFVRMRFHRSWILALSLLLPSLLVIRPSPAQAQHQPPIANPDSYSVDEGRQLVVQPPGVHGNDADPDGDPLTAQLVTPPSHGTLVGGADGSFSYTHRIGFTGVDSFTYSAVDPSGAQSSPATVTITVTPGIGNRSPTANDDSYTVQQGGQLVVEPAGVLANDTDPDGDPLHAHLITPPANGTLTGNTNGSFTYTPTADFSGDDGFTYFAEDPSASHSNPATVTITVIPTGSTPLPGPTPPPSSTPAPPEVNQPPIANSDNYRVAEDNPLDVASPGVLGNDADPDGDPLAASLVTAPANGDLTLNPDGSFSYRPNRDFNGTDSFTYSAVDPSGALSSPATVTFTVTPVNDVPVAIDDHYTMRSLDIVLSVPPPGVLANDSDVEGDFMHAYLVEPPSRGKLVLGSEDGSFSYTPLPSLTSFTDTFTYWVADWAWEGAAMSNVATVTIDVIVDILPPPFGP